MYKKHNINQLAALIEKDWNKINYAAKPYLEAMFSLKTVDDNYYYDNGRSVIMYFLSNAGSWRGPVARDIKAELKNRLK